MIKRYFFMSIAVVITAVIVCIAGEIIIRIEERAKGGHLWTPDTYFYVQHIPHTRFTEVGYKREYITTTHTDQWGFIGRGCELRKPDRNVRIIALGDSFTEAVHVDMDKNFCSLLEKRLNGGKGKYEVINAGLSDYSPKLEYAYLKEKLVHFDPDYLLVQLFANDVYDDYKYRNISEPDSGVPVKRSFFYNHSRFYHYLLRQRAKLMKRLPTKHPERKLNIDQFFFIRKGNDELKKELWQATEQNLLGIMNVARKHNIPLAMFVVPIEAEICTPEEMNPVSQWYFRETATNDFNEHVAQFCAAHNVDFIDMAPVFRDNKKLNLYYRYDGHLTESGHALVARVLYEHLKDKL